MFRNKCGRLALSCKCEKAFSKISNHKANFKGLIA